MDTRTFAKELADRLFHQGSASGHVGPGHLREHADRIVDALKRVPVALERIADAAERIADTVTADRADRTGDPLVVDSGHAKPAEHFQGRPDPCPGQRTPGR